MFGDLLCADYFARVQNFVTRAASPCRPLVPRRDTFPSAPLLTSIPKHNQPDALPLHALPHFDRYSCVACWRVVLLLI